MVSQRGYNAINILSIACAIWYIALGWFWAWLANVLFVFPVALIGFILWIIGRRAENKKLNKVAEIMYIIGTVTSFGVLLYIVLSEQG